MNKILPAFFITLIVALVVATQAFYIVDQRQQAILLQLGQPVGNKDDASSFIKGPGLHLKIPFIQSVRYFDSRILAVDPPPDQVVISSRSFIVPQPPEEGAEGNDGSNDGTIASGIVAPSINDITGEPIILDAFARYKIVDPLQFMKTLRTTSGANSRLSSILQNATKAALGKTSLQQLLSRERENVMKDIQNRVNRTVEKDQLGIQIVDVRITRADLTPALRQSTVTRMQSELKERATETRAKGEERALEIRSTAEKERTVLLAEAKQKAETLKGEGDKEAIKIYADSFNKDKDFYAFIRSMEAYKNTLSSPDTQLILSPNSEFMRFFQDGR